MTKPDYAGLRTYHRARSTRTHVAVLDGIAAGLDTSGGRWQTLCDEHGEVVGHETLALALAHSSAPETWCEVCMGNEEISPQRQQLGERLGKLSAGGDLHADPWEGIVNP